MRNFEMIATVLLMLPAIALAAAECAADNCLRAFVATQTPGRLSSASAFCATFTVRSVAATDVPNFASEHCHGPSRDIVSSRLSSACSCIVTQTAKATSTVAAGIPTSTTACSETFKSAGPTASFTTKAGPPSTNSRPIDGYPTVPACAVVSSSWAAQTAGRAAAPTVEAMLAYDCLKSVPLHKDAAIDLVDSIRPYVEWQSDLAFLKNPPKNYEAGPFDVVGHLDKIRSNIVSDKYDGELAFQEDLFKMTAKVRNGHFQFFPDALTGVFDYIRPFSLVSYSKDPLSTPAIKKWEEIGDRRKEARVIKRLNGLEASAFVEGIVDSASGNQDLDAAYNAMFFSRAKQNVGVMSGVFQAGGWHKSLYPGENTTIEFENGEVETAANVALIKVNFSGVTDGVSFYQKFCSAEKQGSLRFPSQASMQQATVLPAYPEPILSSSDDTVSGYYLQGGGHDDVAVLYITDFAPRNPRIFQRSVELFLAQCKLDGKSKIVVDLQMNPGGYVLQGYDLFRQFFPDVMQDGISRWRENEQFLAMARIHSAATASIDPRTTANEEAVLLWENWWNFRYDLNVSNQRFESFDAKFAPHRWAGDAYTANMRWDLNSTLTTSNKTFGLGIEVTGYGGRRNFTRPFEPQNIVLLTDGFCASTCALFASEMKQAKVRSIAFGGRPNKKPMQAVGGAKGAQVLGYSDIWNMTRQVMASQLTEVSAEQEAALSKLTPLPFHRSTSARLNVRDQILRGNLKDGLPAQFVYEPADCRLFWTLPMLSDMAEIWKAAANAAWNEAGCVAGAGFEKGSKSGIGLKPMASGAAGSSRARIVVSDADIEPGYRASQRELEKYDQRVHVV